MYYSAATGSSCLPAPAGELIVLLKTVRSDLLDFNVLLPLRGLGYYNPYTSHGSFYPGQPGTYSAAGASACSLCPVGTYTTAFGSSACIACTLSISTVAGAAICNGRECILLEENFEGHGLNPLDILMKLIVSFFRA